MAYELVILYFLAMMVVLSAIEVQDFPISKICVNLHLII